MSRADFEYMLNRKIEAGTLYYTTLNGKLVCNRCNYRGLGLILVGSLIKK